MASESRGTDRRILIGGEATEGRQRCVSSEVADMHSVGRVP